MLEHRLTTVKRNRVRLREDFMFQFVARRSRISDIANGDIKGRSRQQTYTSLTHISTSPQCNLPRKMTPCLPLAFSDGHFSCSLRHSCRSNFSRKYCSARTGSRGKSDGVENLYWHLVQEAMNGTLSTDVRTIRKLRSAMTKNSLAQFQSVRHSSRLWVAACNLHGKITGILRRVFAVASEVVLAAGRLDSRSSPNLQNFTAKIR
jgi:hypothetical protein